MRNILTRSHEKFLKITATLLLTFTFAFSGIGSDGAANVSVFAVTQPEELGYNTGHRDTLCQELSVQAMKYYTGEYDEEKLDKLEKEALYDALHSLMNDTVTGNVSYKMLTKYYPYTDAEDGKAGTVLFYSDELPTEKTTISREHVWPKAHASFHETKGGADLHHLRPCHQSENSSRGNTPYGVSSGYYEPNDNVKGDVARILFYLYVRYAEADRYSLTTVCESFDMLLIWNDIDPVDSLEIQRNEVAYSIQGNRNPFIDYPDYADYIWKATD